MRNDHRAAETLSLARRLDAWAGATGGATAATLVGDMTDLYRAAQVYMQAVDRLAELTDAAPAASAQTLVEIQTWLYEELEDHLRSLKDPLDRAIDELYDRKG